MKIIEVESLNYKSIFKNFNISIEKNKFTTISGSNLSGKTTLIRILSKKILTNNMVKIDNKYIEEYNISKLAETLRTVIPSDQKTFRENTIKKELEIITNHKNNLDYYKELIKLFKLTKYLNYNPNEISQKLKTKLDDLVEGAVKAITEYAGYKYTPPTNKNTIQPQNSAKYFINFLL